MSCGSAFSRPTRAEPAISLHCWKATVLSGLELMDANPTSCQHLIRGLFWTLMLEVLSGLDYQSHAWCPWSRQIVFLGVQSQIFLFYKWFFLAPPLCCKVSKQVVMSFCVAGAALCDLPTCLITCGQSFCVAGAILLRRFQKMRCSFRGRRSALDVSTVILRGKLYTPHSTLYSS